MPPTSETLFRIASVSKIFVVSARVLCMCVCVCVCVCVCECCVLVCKLCCVIRFVCMHACVPVCVCVCMYVRTHRGGRGCWREGVCYEKINPHCCVLKYLHPALLGYDTGYDTVLVTLENMKNKQIISLEREK